MIIHDVEQNSEEWLKLRSGMPTASCFSKLVTSKGEPSKSMQGYAQTLAGELYAGHPLDSWQGNIYTDRGHELEDEAALAYEMRGPEVNTIGFVTDNDCMYGCSPDRTVGDDGLIEIKCLPKAHISVLMHFDKHGKVPSDYVVQPQGQMLVTGRAWCDLVFYQPDLPMLVVRQEPDVKIMAGLRDQLQAVLAERDRVMRVLEGY